METLPLLPSPDLNPNGNSIEAIRTIDSQTVQTLFDVLAKDLQGPTEEQMNDPNMVKVTTDTTTFADGRPSKTDHDYE